MESLSHERGFRVPGRSYVTLLVLGLSEPHFPCTFNGLKRVLSTDAHTEGKRSLSSAGWGDKTGSEAQPLLSEPVEKLLLAI